MEDNSYGEELVAVKKRKPYTITKQREKWTDEEHNLFVEALKLYGRAWQRIEEHIGTKTAVQSRSHAQKFFTKLEKEALEKGIPTGQTHDIDIPPPRPKRKPASPYPRKSSTGTSALTEELNGKSSRSMPILSINKEMDAMSDAPRKKFTAKQMVPSKEISEDASCSEVANVFQDALSSAFSSVNKSSSNCSKYMEFLPTKEKMVENIATDKSSIPHEVVQELNKNGESFIGQETERVEGNCTKPQINLDLAEGGITLKIQDLTAKDTVEGVQTHPNHVVRRNDEINMQTEELDGTNPTSVTSQVGVHANSMNPAVSATPVHNVLPIGSMNHPLPILIPFTCLHGDQDAYRSFQNVSSSTFSSLTVSTLLQNPAFHAAATLAAPFWPSAEMETSHSTPEIRTGEFPKRPMNSTPSLEAVAAATVAAAAAWWPAQGLLPWFPGKTGLVLVPPNTNGVLSACTAQGPVRGDAVQNPPREIQQGGDENNCEVLNAEHHSSKLLTLSSSYFDDGEGGDHANDPKGIRSSKLKPSQASGFPDSDKDRRKKKQDGSSCGSNTTSSSEMETETIEKKQEKVNAEGKEAYFSNLPICDTNRRRFRNSGSMNESWKEVSEEGRLAFQALFKREVLPQSFAPLLTQEAARKTAKGEASESLADVYKNDRLYCDTKGETCISSNDRSIGHAKLKVHQTGFKPYKRCSVEAENSAAPVEETGNKRMRLQGEASS